MSGCSACSGRRKISADRLREGPPCNRCSYSFGWKNKHAFLFVRSNHSELQHLWCYHWELVVDGFTPPRCAFAFFISFFLSPTFTHSITLTLFPFLFYSVSIYFSPSHFCVMFNAVCTVIFECAWLLVIQQSLTVFAIASTFDSGSRHWHKSHD